MTQRLAELRADREAIVPEGDRYERGRGLRQFSVRSVLWLLTASAAVSATARSLHADAYTMVALLCVTVALWWQYAETREPPARREARDEEGLLEEIRRWKQEGGGH